MFAYKNIGKHREMRDDIFLKKLGQKIEKERKDQKLTQEEMAILCGFNRATIIRIEKGEVNSTINVLRKISEHLKMSIGELVTL